VAEGREREAPTIRRAAPLISWRWGVNKRPVSSSPFLSSDAEQDVDIEKYYLKVLARQQMCVIHSPELTPCGFYAACF
jgi:hypothetical protein